MRRTAAVLRAEILAGGFPGGALPSEEQLRTEFAVSRACVRSALGLLQDEGVLVRLRGRGTFAIPRALTQSVQELHGIAEFSTTGPAMSRLSAGVIDWKDVPASPIVARMLHVPAGATVLRIDYVGYVEKAAVWGATNYVVYPDAHALEPEQMSDTFYGMLRRAGITFEKSVIRIDAAVADEYDTERFGASSGDPVITVELVYFVGDRPVAIAFSRMGGSRAAFSMQA